MCVRAHKPAARDHVAEKYIISNVHLCAERKSLYIYCEIKSRHGASTAFVFRRMQTGAGELASTWHAFNNFAYAPFVVAVDAGPRRFIVRYRIDAVDWCNIFLLHADRRIYTPLRVLYAAVAWAKPTIEHSESNHLYANNLRARTHGTHPPLGCGAPNNTIEIEFVCALCMRAPANFGMQMRHNSSLVERHARAV